MRDLYIIIHYHNRKEKRMTLVTVSPKFQIVIPKEVRRQAGIRPGQKMAIFQVGDVIELAPVKDIKVLRGSLPGLNTEVDRTDRDPMP